MTDTVVSSATREVVIGFDRPFVIIGERINPTGRKLLAAEMAAGDFSRVESDARAQVEAGAQDQAREGRRVCIDLIREIRSIKGVAGVHVMAYRQEESVAEVITESGVLAGRTPWHPHRPDAQTNPQPESAEQ